jgi:hypothetical protein
MCPMSPQCTWCQQVADHSPITVAATTPSFVDTAKLQSMSDRVSRIEASVVLRTTQCQNCDRFAAVGYETCCGPCKPGEDQHHSDRCPSQPWTAIQTKPPPNQCQQPEVTTTSEAVRSNLGSLFGRTMTAPSLVGGPIFGPITQPPVPNTFSLFATPLGPNAERLSNTEVAVHQSMWYSGYSGDGQPITKVCRKPGCQRLSNPGLTGSIPFDGYCCTTCFLGEKGEHDRLCTGHAGISPFAGQPAQKDVPKVVNRRLPFTKSTTSTTTAATHSGREGNNSVSTTTDNPRGLSEPETIRPGLVVRKLSHGMG